MVDQVVPKLELEPASAANPAATAAAWPLPAGKLTYGHSAEVPWPITAGCSGSRQRALRSPAMAWARIWACWRVLCCRALPSLRRHAWVAVPSLDPSWAPSAATLWPPIALAAATMFRAAAMDGILSLDRDGMIGLVFLPALHTD
jgi:hypothetical protein